MSGLDIIERGIAPDPPSTSAGGDRDAPGTELPEINEESTLSGWLPNQSRYCPDIPSLLSELGARLLAEGVPIERTGIFLRTLHPTILASMYFWRVDREEVTIFERGQDITRADAYLKSPIHLVFEGSPGIRRRLADPACPRDFPIVVDLDEQGITDYLILPLPFSDRARYGVSFATRAAGGFTDQQLKRLAQLTPTLASVVEILSVRRIARNLMTTYLGRETGQRVLDGMIQRGSTETINATIWYSDLRGFTYLTDRLPSNVLISLLNDHFERIVGPIETNGGEVLKFMGDALLAIFPIDALGGEAQAATAALHALDGSLVATADSNLERRQDGQPEVDFWVALHMGDISYGNIGAADRLDFTVIGPAVNQAARIEGHCRVMDRRFLMSGTFAEYSPIPGESIGFHAARGSRASGTFHHTCSQSGDLTPVQIMASAF